MDNDSTGHCWIRFRREAKNLFPPIMSKNLKTISARRHKQTHNNSDTRTLAGCGQSRKAVFWDLFGQTAFKTHNKAQKFSGKDAMLCHQDASSSSLNRQAGYCDIQVMGCWTNTQTQQLTGDHLFRLDIKGQGQSTKDRDQEQRFKDSMQGRWDLWREGKEKIQRPQTLGSKNQKHKA